MCAQASSLFTATTSEENGSYFGSVFAPTNVNHAPRYLNIFYHKRLSCCEWNRFCNPVAVPDLLCFTAYSLRWCTGWSGNPRTILPTPLAHNSCSSNEANAESAAKDAAVAGEIFLHLATGGMAHWVHEWASGTKLLLRKNPFATSKSGCSHPLVYHNLCHWVTHIESSCWGYGFPAIKVICFQWEGEYSRWVLIVDKCMSCF